MQFVQLDFSFFETEEHNDFVYIYDGDSENAHMMARLTGSYTPAPTGYQTTQQSMFIKFVSDAERVARGFEASFTSVPSSSK